MTTRSRQQLLVLLLVFVWTAGRNGVFSNENESIRAHGSYRLRSFSPSDSTVSSTATIDEHQQSTDEDLHGHHHSHHSPHHHRHRHNESTTLHGVNLTEFDIDTAQHTETSSSTHHNHNHNHNHTATKQLHETISSEVDTTEIDELVKPSKIHVQPLHAQDLLYESMKFEPDADVARKVPEHRITGQYRNKSNRIWDPHPQYLIDAFGVHLHLILYQDNSFIPKHMKITHVYHNEMQRTIEDHKTHDELRGCFYRGRVRTDDRSAVAVSLCDGMRGHIYTSSGSFFIEPVEEYTIDNQNILHKISRESLPLDKVDLKKHGKVLVDEMSIHEDEVEKIDDSIADEDLDDESFYNNSTDDADAPVIACTTNDGKSKLSMPHDDDSKCQKFRNEDGSSSQHIMSRMLDHNTHPWSWSACSRHYVTEYLEHNKGICMLNKPHLDMIETTSQLLAGEKFPADQQCELIFGPNSKVCPFTVTVSIFGQEVDQPPCIRLWCGSESEGCRTQHMPWADGTECASGHWCQHGKCVPRNRQALTKVDGGWGPWKPFGQCSRTCGGGVQSSIRDCNSPSPANGGKYCIGTRIKYRSCNTQDCPPDTMDFREEQCADMNNNNFEITGLDKDVRWVPKYGQSPHDECKLYCRVEKTNNYFLLNEKVKDGTSCSHESFNKCVNGICRPAGCDNQLDSDAQLDKCGVCNGNNGTCHDIIGSFRPEQIERAKAYTLMDDQGEYILNGYNVITQYPRVFPYGGVTFEYTGTNSTLERVNTTFARRLKRDLTVEILSRSESFVTNELIRYSYTMDLNETRNTHVDFYPYNQNQNPSYQSNRPSYPSQSIQQYKWEMSQWSECNTLCNGEQFRAATCVQIESGRHVSPTLCQDSKPQNEYQECNAGCVIEWEIQRSKCSVECGEGVQQLSYSCIQTFPQTNHRKVVDDSHCPTSQRSKLYEKCVGPCPSATWTYEEFGQCSKPCNSGVQSRQMFCTSHYRGQIIDDKFCENLPKESLERICNTHECPKWQFGDETACSVTCGSGFKTRTAICVQNNKVVNSNECDAQTKPNDMRIMCQLDPCWRKNPTQTPVLYSRDNSPRIVNSYRNRIDIDSGKPSYTYRTTPARRIYTPPTSTSTPTTTTTTTTTPRPVTSSIPRQSPYRFIWRTSRWSACSASCDGGYRVRSVRCVNENSNQVVDDRYCVDEKPVVLTNCAQQRCPKWRTSAWGQCNDSCKKYRQVVCQDDRHHTNITNCPLNTRPHSIEECCQFRWRNLWTPCSAECGNGTRSRQRVCMRLFARSRNEKPQARKRGQQVSEKYCQHMKQPPFTPKTRVYRKQMCAAPKWDVPPWSPCSVGCGKGYSTRQVRCMVGAAKVNELMCRNQPKPSATRHCETTTQCEWKIGQWKQCSCGGYTKRRVQCFDRKLMRQSNSCLNVNKPEQKRRCDQPATCSCKGLQKSHRVYMDGDYLLNIRGRKVQIYCHRMNTTNPQEYISLKNERENYSLYFDRRSRNKDECSTDERNQVTDPSIASGLTYFSKVRVIPHSLEVIIDDFTFARTSGRKHQAFGSAGDCFSTTQRCPRGAFSINFEHTKFRIRPKTRWETRGMNAIQHFYGFEAPYQKKTSVCGGYCGNCFPSRDTGLHLEVI